MNTPTISKGSFGSQKDKTRQVIASHSVSDRTEEQEKEVPVVSTYSGNEERPAYKKAGKKTGRNKQNVSITLDNEVVDFIERKSKETNVKKSVLIEIAIKEYYQI